MVAQASLRGATQVCKHGSSYYVILSVTGIFLCYIACCSMLLLHNQVTRCMS